MLSCGPTCPTSGSRPFKQGEPPTLFLRGFRPPRAPPLPLPGPQLSQCQLGERSTGLASVTSPQRQDSLGPHLPFGEVRDCPGSSPARLSAAVKETCAWFTDNYEQARK